MFKFIISAILILMVTLFVIVDLAPRESFKDYDDFMKLEHKPRE